MTKLVLVASLLAASTAHADQCQTVTPAQAADAVKLLTGALITLNCPPCNDPPIAVVPTVKPGKIAQHPSSAVKGMSTVALDGKDVDLAYTWILTGKATFTNVAQAVGCETKDVPGFMTIGQRAAPVDVAKLEAEDAAMQIKVDAGVQAFTNAQNDADRNAARARLEALRKEQNALRTRLAAAKAAAAHDARTHGMAIPQRCLDNPLAKGCP